MDNFLEKVRRSRKPINVAVPNAGLAFGTHMHGILEGMGADVYPIIYDHYIEFEGRDVSAITDGKLNNDSFKEMKEEELIATNLEILSKTDALFIPGGDHLRQRKSLDEGRELSKRIKVEMACYAEAMKRGMPIFGICAGAQAMVFYEGASLAKMEQGHWPNYPFITRYPRLDPELRAEVEHGQMIQALAMLPLGLGNGRYFQPMHDEMSKTGHELELTPGSKLEGLIGNLVKGRKVCTSHVKGIVPETIPAQVAVTARSVPDLAVEAIERPGYKSFWLGVMFLPEHSREFIEPVVNDFLKSAAQFRDSGKGR